MEEQIKTAPQTDVEVVDIQFRSGQKIYFFDPDGQRFADGDHIIIDTARGEEFRHLRGRESQNPAEKRGSAPAEGASQSHPPGRKNDTGESGEGKTRLRGLPAENRGAWAGHAAGERGGGL